MNILAKENFYFNSIAPSLSNCIQETFFNYPLEETTTLLKKRKNLKVQLEQLETSPLDTQSNNSSNLDALLQEQTSTEQSSFNSLQNMVDLSFSLNFPLQTSQQDEREKVKNEKNTQILQKIPQTKLFKVQRRANYIDLFIKEIAFNETIMLTGDFTVDRKVFQKIENNEVDPYCPLKKFRPKVFVETGNNYIISVLNISYTGSSNFDAAIQMLNSVSNKKALDISKFLSQYKEQLNQMNSVKQCLIPFMQKPEIREKIRINHEESMKVARRHMEEVDKSKVYIFGYMKYDVETCTNKIYFAGGNSKFCEVFIGVNDINLMRHYVQRYGFPGYNDSLGNVNVLYSKFLLQNTYKANLSTFDEESVPFDAERKFIPLHQLEIAPGIFVGDKFEIRELKIPSAALSRLESDRMKTNSVQAYLKVEDLAYSLEAEQFISKFYKSKIVKLSQQDNNNNNNYNNFPCYMNNLEGNRGFNSMNFHKEEQL